MLLVGRNAQLVTRAKHSFGRDTSEAPLGDGQVRPQAPPHEDERNDVAGFQVRSAGHDGNGVAAGPNPRDEEVVSARVRLDALNAGDHDAVPLGADVMDGSHLGAGER